MIYSQGSTDGITVKDKVVENKIATNPGNESAANIADSQKNSLLEDTKQAIVYPSSMFKIKENSFEANPYVLANALGSQTESEEKDSS